MRRKFVLYLTLGMLALLPAQAGAQRKAKPVTETNTKKRIKKLKKLEEDKEKDAARAEKDLYKQHLAIQDKATRKRMKKNKKKSKKIKAHKREFFLKRWFTKK